MSTNIIYGAPEGQDARILAEHARVLMPRDKVLIHVALDDSRVSTLTELLHFFAPDVQVLSLPAWDCLPYDRVSPHGDIVAHRISALSRLLEWESEQERYPRILLTTVNAINQRVMPRTALENASLAVRVGGRLDMARLQNFLAMSGYLRTETVREAGDFAIRGGIIDLFPPSYAEPLRIDLFGDEVETIRSFDPLTQRTKEKICFIALQPVSEFVMNKATIARFRAKYREAFGVVRSGDPLYEAVSEGRRYNGMDHWLPLFYESMDSVFDYAPGAAITFDHHALDSYKERVSQIEDFYQARITLEHAALSKKKKGEDVSLSGSIYHPLKPDMLYLDDKAWSNFTTHAKILSPFGSPNDLSGEAKKGRDFADIRSLPDGDVFKALKAHITTLGNTLLIACYSQGSLERMKGLLEAGSIGTLIECADYRAVKKLKPGQIGLSLLTLDNGFVASDLAVLTEQDILGDRLVRKSKKRRKNDNFLTEVSSLNEGDLIVHIDHGVGKFLALETVKVGKILHDCLKVEYAGGDKLFVPVENIEVLSRFGGDEGIMQLDKLGGAGWQARKTRVKKDLMVMADHLLQIAAARQLRTAQKLDLSQDIYNEFAARFPYVETEDQERAIKDVIADLASGHPMDRLICGDVGFGKTEVALRAAYIAAMEGVQVALAVPTTLLARQHFMNFTKRFAGTGLRVEQLSRMVSAKDASLTKDGLREGSVNIVIGTHALFGKGVKFDNLGLLIIDEEQRFGVKQKERLKEIKNDVHVLTLTATPIPRTLQMSLTGVKEMSLIATPPVDRLAVRTFILPFDAMVVRDALLREHYRGGQSFYVCPRIKDIKEVEDSLKDLVPELKIIAAHGQMTPDELEDRMTAFYDGQYDVLLATNIIESGIDIPTANTLVIHRADMFGLSQLYQIRGRVGRSKLRAHAYLTYPPHQKLQPQAQKRLEVMDTLDTLGSGFQLASHDMDIRGAGNLLGEQQSGQIREIGVELYQQMLEEAVAAAKEGTDFDEQADKNWSPQINIGMSVLIPETYVEDLGVRMSLYRRISELEDTHEIESFAAELIDRFGTIPDEVNNLMDIVAIKHLSKKAGISQVDAGPKGAVLTFHDNTPPNVEALMSWIVKQRGAVKLRPDQKLVSMRQWDTPAQRVKGVQSLMKELADFT